MKKVIIFASFLIITFTQNIFAQIDTNNVYPLHKGNLWEYTNYIDIHYYEVIVGTKTMPNGKAYKKRMSINLIENELAWDTLYTYWRVENEHVYEYKGNLENKLYDLSLNEGSIWQNNPLLNQGRIISSRYKNYNHMFQDTLSFFFMENILFDTLQNPPDTSILIGVWDGITKGVGPTLYTSGTNLSGAIINGQKYGYVTVAVEDEQPILNNYEIEISAYPNPFNSICNVVFTVKKTQKIKLKLFNILGEEVYTLFLGKLQKGEQHFNLNMPKEISSGIFFILLETEKSNYSKKILYLK